MNSWKHRVLFSDVAFFLKASTSQFSGEKIYYATLGLSKREGGRKLSYWLWMSFMVRVSFLDSHFCATSNPQRTRYDQIFLIFFVVVGITRILNALGYWFCILFIQRWREFLTGVWFWAELTLGTETGNFICLYTPYHPVIKTVRGIREWYGIEFTIMTIIITPTDKMTGSCVLYTVLVCRSAVDVNIDTCIDTIGMFQIKNAII